jgi:type 2 lantibiotic biosynthesis protein LanM
MGSQASTDHDLARIAVAASSLWERLDGGYEPDDSDGPDGPDAHDAHAGRALAAQRLAHWCDKAADGNEERFTTRLGWLGRSRDQVLPLLGRVRLAGPEPAWLATFVRVMHAPRRWDSFAQADRHPFGHLLAPFVHAGQSLLASSLDLHGRPHGRVFGQEAEDALLDDLFRRLSYIAGPSLYLELATFRSTELRGARPDPDSDRVYRAFTERLWNDGLGRFFTEYAVLARLLVQAVELWVDGVRELAAAFAADRAELERRFAAGASLGDIRRVRCGLSDLHNGHRTVVLVTCESGVELYYKPRDLGIEAAWYRLLDHLREGSDDLRSFRVVARPDHGWVEPAPPAPCRDQSEAHLFYRRAGALLCLQYALEASDCFYENIVASGGHPVLIDHETLMHHVIRRHDSLVSAADLADDVVFNSVLRAGFLPSWEPGHDGTCVDISGLGATPGQVTPYRKRRWSHVNTDAVSLGHEPICIDTDAHLPKLDGQILSPAPYTEDLIDGFRDMYDRLLAKLPSLCAPEGPIEHLGRQQIRLVFHATRIYGLLLKRLYSPRHMRHGVDRSIELDVVSRFYLEAPEKAHFVPILAAELQALERLDIPYFSVPADSHDLALPTGEVIENAFAETAVARVDKRLRGLGPADRDRQQSFIRTAIVMSAQLVEHRDEPGGEPESRDAGPAEPLGPAALVEEAKRIATLIAERAIISPQGHATWIAPQLLSQTGRQHLSPLRMDLYSGIGGIALLFSALHRVSGTGRDIAWAALSSLREFLAAVDRPTLTRRGYGLGAASGFGSFLYVMTRASTLLGEPALLDSVETALDLLDPEWIEADREHDVMAGAAGALLGLVAYHRASGSERARDLARQCAEHLLARQTPTPHGGASWRATSGHYLTGMSHGAAGIAMALARLHDLTGDPRLRVAVQDALAFENAVFDAARGNWPDFRHWRPDRPAFMETWCHGAPGIGLARAAAPPVVDDPVVAQAIDAAVTTVKNVGIGPRDGLCCGNAGRIDLLVTVARLRQAPALMQLAGEQMSAIVARARHRGYRFTPSAGQELFDPSFFQGLSGVGYELLRCADPGAVPSAVTFE